MALVALALRLPGLGWGLKNDLHNQSYHPDEELNVRVSRAVDPAHLSFTPGFYNYGTLYFTLLRVAEDGVAAYGGGPPKGPNDWDYLRRCELAGRGVSVVSGVLLCLATYYAVVRIAGRFGATLAGLSVAVAAGLAVHSHFATVDVTATLFAALALLYALRLGLDEDPPWLRSALLAGLCVGFAAGTKYTGAVAILSPLCALALRRPPRWLGLCAAVLAASAGAFLISTPGAVLDAAAFVRDVRFEAAHAASGHGMVFTGTSPGYLYHLASLFLGYGTLMTLIGLGGLAWGAWSRQRWAWIVLAFALPYYLAIGGAQVKFLRYTFPLVACVAVGFGYAVGESNRRGGAWRLLVAGGILGLGGMDGGGLVGGVRYVGSMVGPDPRDVVAAYVKDRSDDRTSVGLVDDPWFWTPPYYPDVGLLRAVPAAERLALELAATRPRVVQARDAQGLAQSWDPRLVTELRPDYISVSAFELAPVLRVSEMDRVPDEFAAEIDRYRAFDAALRRDYDLELAIPNRPPTDVPEDMTYTTPQLFLWRRKSSP